MKKHFDKVWINNLSTSSDTPLLTLSIVIDEETFKKNPLHVVQRHEEDQQRHILVLSFLTPEDLDKLQNAIDIARIAKLNDTEMMKLWHAEHDQNIVYGVGIYRPEPPNQGFGMLYGPNPDLRDMLKTYPKALLGHKDYDAFEVYIIKFTKEVDIDEPVTNEMYIWNKVHEEWQPMS